MSRCSLHKLQNNEQGFCPKCETDPQLVILTCKTCGKPFVQNRENIRPEEIYSSTRECSRCFMSKVMPFFQERSDLSKSEIPEKRLKAEVAVKHIGLSRPVTLILIAVAFFLCLTIGIYIVKSNREAPNSTPGSLGGAATSTCKFCGVWEYYNQEAQSNNWLKIITAGAGKFRLVPGYEYPKGNIVWQDDLDINNADGIYLKSVNGKLVGSFRSSNFRATHSYEFTYTITCEFKPDGKMSYTVTWSGSTERYEATKKS